MLKGLSIAVIATGPLLGSEIALYVLVQTK